LALDFRPPELDFRPPDFRAPDRLDDLLDDFRPPDDALRPDFFPPDDLDAVFAAFFRLPPAAFRLLDPPVDPLVGLLAEPDVPPERVAGLDDDPPLPNELGRPALADVPEPRPEVVPEEERLLPNAELPEAPPPPMPPSPPPLLPPPVRDDSCFLPEPFGRPLLPLGAPPPKRSSSSSPSATTVASVSGSSSSSASSALSQRRSL